jgi:hypothetical protein
MKVVCCFAQICQISEWVLRHISTENHLDLNEVKVRMKFSKIVSSHMSDCNWDRQIKGETAKLNAKELYIRNANSIMFH